MRDDPREVRTEPARRPPSNRALWHLGVRQMLVTVALVIVLNVVARRMGLNLTGSIVLCAALALAWPFLATWWRRRR